VAIFFPWNISTFVAMPAAIALPADLLFFLAKVILVLFFSVTLIRVAMARFRISQIIPVYWVYLSVIGLVGLLLLMADTVVPLVGVGA
jgi:NADH-quinone oxidoreductase subunit H